MGTWADAKGTRKGSPRAISQHKAIAEGYEAAPATNKGSMTFQRKSMTGSTHAPGFTTRGVKR